jgi:hypothetical protein
MSRLRLRADKETNRRLRSGAQAPSLAGKNVQVIIGSGSGGGFDFWGRLVARRIGKHLPGTPTVVPQNMPGAGGFNAANHIYNVASKDGTAMGIIAGAAVLGPITGATGARFDPTRITLLGSPTTDSVARRRRTDPRPGPAQLGCRDQDNADENGTRGASARGCPDCL